MNKLQKLLLALVLAEYACILFLGINSVEASSGDYPVVATPPEGEVCSIPVREITSLIESVTYAKENFLYASDLTVPQMWWGELLGLNESLEYPLERNELEENIRRLRERNYVLPGFRTFLTLDSVKENRNARDFFLFLSHVCETGRMREPLRQLGMAFRRGYASLNNPYSRYLSPEESQAFFKEEIVADTSVTEQESFVRAYRLNDNFYLLRIDSFMSQKIASDVRSGLEAIARECHSPNIILDLRSNLGGFMIAAVETAGIFLGDQVILRAEDREGVSRLLKRNQSDVDVDIQIKSLSVLVNYFTASASEIVTMALKESGATVLGSETYGKGVAQTFKFLPNGGATLVTHYRLYSRESNSWQGYGIEPDVRINTFLTSKETEMWETESRDQLKNPQDDSSFMTAYRYIHRENEDNLSCE